MVGTYITQLTATAGTVRRQGIARLIVPLTLGN